MAGLRWTKFQDFYLRLGLLKALVAVLDPRRRSSALEDLLRRLEKPLFTPAKAYDELWRGLPEGFPWRSNAMKQREGLKSREASVAEALLEFGDCPSTLLAVTGSTVYKVVDWGRNVGLLGEGHQITEKGLLLRSLLPEPSVAQFFAGNPLAWNPFVLTPPEKLFLLHHFFEVDELTILVLDALGGRSSTGPLQTSDASQITCRVFFELLRKAEARAATSELPALLRAKRLAAAISVDLNPNEPNPYSHLLRAQPPRAPKVGRRGGQPRKTTKNADHQTIPRFEQLVDLGFLDKPVSATASPAERHVARGHWRWQPTAAAVAWGECRREHETTPEPWEWHHFSETAIRTGLVRLADLGIAVTLPVVVRYLWRPYEKVRRPVGHTPLYSIALMAMLEATSEGRVVEMKTFHDLMLDIKTRGLLPEHAFFASGNELDKMFVILRPGFEEAVSKLTTKEPLANLTTRGVEGVGR